MEGISRELFRHWMDAYGKACIDKDAQAFGYLFADHARYYEMPFEKPFRGPSAISQYLKNAATLMVNVQFLYHTLAVSERIGVALWQGGFTEVASGKRVKLNGVFLVEFNAQHKCQVFREWWHRIEEPCE